MKRDNLFSAFFFVIVWIAYGYGSSQYSQMHQLPMGVHQSAQCDRASLAQNYFYGGFRFIYPEVNENRCIDGIVSCEMPVPAFLAAGLYFAFGYQEFYFRLLSYIFFSMGMLGLFFLFKTRMSSILALVLILIIQSSPILLFYAANFLPDISSLGLALMAWLLFFLQHIPHPWQAHKKSLWIQTAFIVSLTLSIAIKTTSLLQWITMLSVLSASYIPSIKIRILQRRKLVFSLCTAMLIPLAWYFWSRHLSLTHNSQYFMMQLPHSESWESYTLAWQVYLANWPSQTFSYPLLYFAVGFLFLPLFLKRFIQRELWLISLINSLGAISFLFLMVEQFKYHDYYAICLFTAFALNWLALADAATKIKSEFWWVRFTFFLLILLACNFQFNTGRKNLEERYTEGNYWEQSHVRSKDLDSFRTMIKAIGIDRNSCVLAGYDPAPNNLLYLLHLRGHRVSKDHDHERLNYILNGAHPQYLISTDSSFTAQVQEIVKETKPMLSYKNLSLYRLSY